MTIPISLRVMIIISSVLTLSSCSGSNFEQLSRDDQRILLTFFDKTAIVGCPLVINDIGYSRNISGLYLLPASIHDDMDEVLFENHTKYGEEDLRAATPMYFPRRGSGVPRPQLDQDEISEIVQSGNFEMRSQRENIEGWIVNGSNKCAERMGLRSDRFILVLSYGNKR